MPPLPILRNAFTTKAHPVFTDLFDVPPSYAGQAGNFVSVKVAEDGLEFTPAPGSASYFNLVGTAYIGGDQTGNARGANALDVQSLRAAATQVASGVKSISIGLDNTASGYFSTAVGIENIASSNSGAAFGSGNNSSGDFASTFGHTNTASGYYCLALGYGNSSTGFGSLSIGSTNTSSGFYSSAIGSSCQAIGDFSNAIGSGSAARIESTTNISGPQINRQSDGSSAFRSYSGVRVVLMTNVVDLKVSETVEIPIPSGAHFFPDECGVIVTNANTVTVHPTVSFGNTGNHAAFLAATLATGLTAAQARQRFQTLLTSDGQATLDATVTVGATATALDGRFYFTGLLVEDQ